MSKNNTVNNTRGIQRVTELAPQPQGIATKVTGHNLAAVSLIVSLEAERRGITMSAEAGFATNGQLLGVIVREQSLDGQPPAEIMVTPGDYLYLGHDELQAKLLSASEFSRSFRVNA